jgi:polyisoprenyl-teichoic acid--peptidoglycan teichoic acid transferase
MVDHKEETQPVAIKAIKTVKNPRNNTSRDKRRGLRIKRTFQLFWVLLIVFFLGFVTTVGGLSGYFTGQAQRQLNGVVSDSQTVEQQFLLGIKDQEEGRLEIARQRYEWVLNQDTDFPGAVQRLSEVLAILNATATPTQLPPTITPTPTPDLRPIQDLFTSGQAYFNTQEWTKAIDTLINLRQKDPMYQVVESDRMLFLSLRNRGINKVFQQGDLNGGMYDLVLAERFSPLDTDARSAREWARLYLIGSSFWDVYPEQAVYFFSQVASAIPSLRDSSGWTARERLRGALIQWGDQLMSSEEWCAAQSKFEQAAELGLDSALQASLERSIKECTPPTDTPTHTPTLTFTPTITTTLVIETATLTPAPSSTVTATNTPVVVSSPTPTPTSTYTPLPTTPPTATPPPSDTPTPPPATNTPSSLNLTPTQDSNVDLSPNPSDPLKPFPWYIPTALALLGIFGIHKRNKPVPKTGKNQTREHNQLFRQISRFIVPIIISGLVIVLAIVAATVAFIIGRELALFGTGLSFLNTPEIMTTNSAGVLVNAEGTPVIDEFIQGAPDRIDNLELAPWDGASRVTVLLLGLDYRDWDAEDKYSRSDTMILLTLDPLTKSAGILSVPRDMWVAIPGFKHGKINTAYYLGDAYKLPGGGPALAVKTVESFLGVPINYYAQIDFDAFVKFIDEIGGVKITVPEPITIDLLGSGPSTKKNLKPGEQVLPGDHALAYARARYTEGGDFDRATRQQQVIMGIRDRVLDFNLLPGLVTKAPTLYKELSSGIRTNMTVDQVIRLALLAQSVPDENIQRGVLGEKYVLFARSPDNLSILIPLPDKIHELRDQIFAASGALNPATPGDAAERMRAEAPKISLYNGTNDESLESKTREWLSTKGAIVSQAGNTSTTYPATTIIDYTGNPFTVKYLVETMGINHFRIRRDFIPDNPIDIELILGNDWRQNSSFD